MIYFFPIGKPLVINYNEDLLNNYMICTLVDLLKRIRIFILIYFF